MNKNKKVLLIIFSIITILILIFIFGNSLFSKDQSSTESGFIYNLCKPLLDFIFGKDVITHNIFRKMAHFSEYMLISLDIMILYIIKNNDSFYKNIYYPISIGLFIGVIDESLQIISDRGPAILDVLIDYSGYLTGIIIVILIKMIIKLVKKIVLFRGCIMRKKPIYDIFKRIFDILCSTLAIIVLFIPMLVVAILIKIDSKGPIFFKQKRIGKNKKTFNMLKFRSMYIDTDPNAPTHLLDNANSHITKVGTFIRKFSIDELPQLFNIFIGQMTIIGPRPALWNQYDLITERDLYCANDVKPGLSGLAQISGRDELDIKSKAKLDGEYVKKREFFYDIYLIIKTVFKVFKHDGVKEGRN